MSFSLWVCKKSDWMLTAAVQHCTSTKLFCKCSALRGQTTSWPSHLSFVFISHQIRGRFPLKLVFLFGRWNKKSFRTDMNIFNDYPIYSPVSSLLETERQNCQWAHKEKLFEHCFVWCFYPRNICWADFKLVMGESICRPCRMLELLVSRLQNVLWTVTFLSVP